MFRSIRTNDGRAQHLDSCLTSHWSTTTILRDKPLPKQLGECWEAERTRFEAMLRAQETVPLEAVTIAVSLDGVMVPMKDGGRAQKRDEEGPR